MILVSASASAQGHGAGPKPKPPSSPAVHGPTTHGSSASAQSHAGSHPQGGPKTAHGTSPSVAHATATKGHGSSTTTATGKKNTTTTATTTNTANVTLTPVQQKLQKNTNLASKVSSRLPEGTNLMTASDGFRNLGQFVAAVNVSNNLGISFTDLKSRMVDGNMSLGQAIKQLRPTADATLQSRRAESDADLMIRTSEDTTPTKHQKSATKKKG